MVVAYFTAAVQHFSNKTGPNILVAKYIPGLSESTVKHTVKDSTSNRSDAIARVTYKCWRARVLMIKGFADIVIAHITAGQINHYFAEIAPRTVYPLYGM